MVKVLETLSVNLKWHTTIGYAVFSCGLAVVVMTIYSIFFAGALQSQVIANSKELEILERKVDQTMSYIDRKIDRHTDTEHHEMKAH
jgi:sensor domain CHASE-containing protein